MLSRTIILAWLYTATALGATISTDGSPLSERDVAPRKYPNALTFMSFPIYDCSSNGILETHPDEQCVRLQARTKSLEIKRLITNCRSELSVVNSGP